MAAAATIDELLASEARANLQRAKAANRNEPAKPKPRISVPPARIVARTVQPPAWKTPFVSLVMIVGLSTLISAGSTAYVLLRPEMTSGVSEADLRHIRESVSQLRRQVAEITPHRSASETTQPATVDRTQNPPRRESPGPVATTTARIASATATLPQAAPAAAEITGTVRTAPATAAPSRETLMGWSIRRAYDGVAILEGKSGIIEVVQGQDVPHLGRILDIKRENDRWQVSTSKGVIVTSR